MFRRKEKKRKDYAFQRQFAEKPSTILSCPCSGVCTGLQVLPATSSDLVSMDRELISAQHDRAFMPAPHQHAGNADSLNRSKPGSLLSMDSGNAAGQAGSFSSYDKLQGMPLLPENMRVQHANENGMAEWGQQTMDGFASAHSVSTISHGTRGRHTHDE